jgi:predicted TIM-barrel fold metal-dependent hydrolase
MNIYDEPKIDCHNHIFDPVGFPYALGVHYHPAGQETGSADYFLHVLDAYGTRFAVMVGPNSGYETDNRCLLDAIARSHGRIRGIAVVAHDTSSDALVALKAQGIIGVAFNLTLHGVDYYRDAAPLLARLAALDLFINVQVEHAQLVALAPLLLDSGARILIDHCGRPTPELGLGQPGFEALLALADTRRAWVKLSGYVKFSRDPYPHADTHPFVHALLERFTPDGCLWASDWPFIKATARVDYGLMLRLVERLIPGPDDRRRVLWDTPAKLFGFT